jgi:hypothetical protein
MTITSPTPTRAPFDQDKVRSKSPFAVDWTRGTMTATTGQVATVTRAAPNAAVVAGNEIIRFTGTNRPRILHFVRATA